MSLDPKSINQAIREIKDYKKWFLKKTKELTEAIAILGAKEAAHWFGTAMYDGDNDVTIDVKPTESSKGWTITANGQAVAFIEFGSGVYHNTAEPYPSPRPPGIVGIGEYGQGKGKRQGWIYFDGGEKVFTRGNPASMPMYRASESMKKDLVKVAREVFG